MLQYFIGRTAEKVSSGTTENVNTLKLGLNGISLPKATKFNDPRKNKWQD